MPGNVATFLLGPFAAGNAASIVAANTPGGAGNLAIVGGSPFAMDVPRRVGITLGAEAASRLVKITGTLPGPGGAIAGGPTITETLLCPAAGVTVSRLDYAQVTAITVFAAFTANMTVGTVVAGGAVGSPVASTPWFLVDIYRIPIYLSVGVSRLDSTAALGNGYTVEATFDDINAAYENPGVLAIPSSINPQSNNPLVIYDDGATIGVFTAASAKKTGNQAGPVNCGPFALRVALYDTTPAQITAQFIQAGALGA